MSAVPVEDRPLPVEQGRLELRLRRVVAEARDGRPAVLLLHGANTNSDNFLVPAGGLALFLSRAGYDVWLLDWRGSPWVIEPLMAKGALDDSPRAERAYFTVDRVAEVDIPTALRAMRESIGGETPVSIFAHCIGAGATAMAIARRILDPPELRLASVVLSTMGLFYRVPWAGWLKAEDYLLERALDEDREVRAIDPKDDRGWPDAFHKSFDRWPKAWLPAGRTPADEMLQRLTFMFGRPYTPTLLDARITPGELLTFFGPIHMGLYLHAAQLVRRGFADRFDAPDVVDRHRVRRARIPSPARPCGDLVLEPFRRLPVTLLVAADNQLWHRDSMDMMYEWLCRIPIAERAVKKRVFPGNIQELLWGYEAVNTVFPAVAEALRG